MEGTAKESFFAALRATGMPAPEEFSVVPKPQIVPAATLNEIAEFIRVFDAVTARAAWLRAVWREAPAFVRDKRSEICFFSAWDFHLPPEGGSRMIEFNDNGSGFLFAAIINACYYEQAGQRLDETIAAPFARPAFSRYICELVEKEANAFFAKSRQGSFLILDDAESMRSGKFRDEHRLLRDLFRERGWAAEIACPAQLRWDGRRLLFEERPVGFVVNRSTDFLWSSNESASLRRAFESGDVYIAPNPFTYATRSDKRLLEWLSLPHWDEELGIRPEERRILNAHVPETHVVRVGSAEMLAQRKADFVFKPLHGFAGRGLLDSDAIGRGRLRRLASHGDGYVAQRRVAKPCIDVEGTSLWTDLRVWAYRGKAFLLSGRASRRPERLDLTPPGGWLPTYASL